MEGLKPCPFCGSGWHRKEFGVFILWHEPTCVFGGPNGVVHSTTMAELFATKWNTRANDQLIEEIEQLRVQLAGCGVAAMSNTHESREQQRIDPGDYGYSGSYQDVFDAVGREIKYRELLEEMARAYQAACDFIDSHVCDYDITQEMAEKYQAFLDKKDAMQKYRGGLS